MKAVSAKEQAELIDVIVKGKAQSIAVHIKKSPPENLDINARVPGGVHVGLTPLHCAVKHTRDPLVVAELLETLKADPNVRAAGSNATPLHLAAKQGDLAIIEALLTRGASPNAADKDGWTACSSRRSTATPSARRRSSARARRCSHDQKRRAADGGLHLKCDAGANAEPLIRVLCFEGNTSLAAALVASRAAARRRSTVRRSTTCSAARRLLLECGAPVNAPQGKQLMAQREQGRGRREGGARERQQGRRRRGGGAAEASEARRSGRRRSLDDGDAAPRGVAARPPSSSCGSSSSRSGAVNLLNVKGESALHLAMQSNTPAHTKTGSCCSSPAPPPPPRRPRARARSTSRARG